MEAANIVLLKSDLRDVVTAIHLSKVALRRIKINFFWAFLYNTLLIPIAAGCIYIWAGFRMSPILAGSAMAASSICVVLSSLLLKLYKPPNLDPKSKFKQSII
jgi:Cu+-exporting ATPase